MTLTSIEDRDRQEAKLIRASYLSSLAKSKPKAKYGWFTKTHKRQPIYFDWLKLIGVTVVAIMLTTIAGWCISPTLFHLLKVFGMILIIAVIGIVID